MAERKQIPKSVRFDVFKRDGFTCQYCGKMAPDVILEIDHIRPVSDDGDNSILNLVTSCRDCNRGKGPKKLDDNATVKRQQKQLAEFHERKEQLEMMLKWKSEMASITEIQIDSISTIISEFYNHSLSDWGRADVRRLIKRFSYEEVVRATETACLQYKTPSEAVNKIGGICFNKRLGKEGWDK